ncbi:aldo/keto reductase [Flavihumibacter sediminis]|nr:aldo/keto reductase [Flavihumibacter sediminis]
MKQQYSRREILKLLGVTGIGAALLPLNAFHPVQSSMMQRIIPSSGEKLPVVGLGTWQQFDVGSDAAVRAPLKQVLQEMVRLGGKLIDSSPMYARSEEVIGDLTTETGHANDFFYATKVWTRGRQEGIDQMNASLKKMRRKTMDLMQIHNLVDWQTHFTTLRKWKEEGRIRYIGITHYTDSAHEDLERIIVKEKPDFVQFNYSIRERNAEKRLLAAAKDTGVAVIINEPFEKGELFGLVKGKSLPSWAAEYDINSWGQYFLKYIISHPAVNCVIPGTSNPKHVADNMGAGYGKLPDEAGRKKMISHLQQV